MNTEIEVKFLNTNHDDIRSKLKTLGATLKQPMRLMRRVVIHTKVMDNKTAFLRIRDEGFRTTITYKQFDEDSIDGAKEYEVEVSSFDDAINIFRESGLAYDAFQETKREDWELNGVEIMLDEWPWLNPYIEIEGASEKAVRNTAAKLGLDWNTAVFGAVGNAYLQQYPHIGQKGITVINREWSIIKFGDPTPKLLLHS